MLCRVRGEEALYAASEVVRPGDRLALKPADWEFLAPYLMTLDPSWIRTLRQWRNGEASSEDFKDQVHLALGALRSLGLDEATSTSRIFSKIADAFFPQAPLIQDCARLARIAAKLEANVSDNFKFVNQDARLRAKGSSPTLADIDGSLEPVCR